jgi:hypothetical protein
MHITASTPGNYKWPLELHVASAALYRHAAKYTSRRLQVAPAALYRHAAKYTSRP